MPAKRSNGSVQATPAIRQEQYDEYRRCPSPKAGDRAGTAATSGSLVLGRVQLLNCPSRRAAPRRPEGDTCPAGGVSPRITFLTLEPGGRHIGIWGGRGERCAGHRPFCPPRSAGRRPAMPCILALRTSHRQVLRLMQIPLSQSRRRRRRRSYVRQTPPRPVDA